MENTVPTISSSNDLIIDVEDDIFIMHKMQPWIKFLNPEREVEITGNIDASGYIIANNITASGNISASKNLFASLSLKTNDNNIISLR